EGKTHGRETLTDDSFNEVEFAASLERSHLTFALCWYYTIKGELAFLYEDCIEALAMLQKAGDMLPGINFMPEIRYYAALSLLALGPEAVEEDKQRRAPILARCTEDLGTWAKCCSDNYLHKSLLVQAEVSRNSGQDAQAMDLYHQAIDEAQKGGWL